MLFDAFSDLNWLAVIAAAIAWFIIGAVWYSDALFGKQWREATGVEMPESGMPDPKVMVGTLVLYLITAITMGLIAVSIGADDIGDGIVLGLVTSIGFVGVNRTVQGLYEGMDRAVMRVNAPLNIVSFVVMGIILSTWT